jgi:pseudouridine-5'-phosphate glycosidase
MELLAVADEVRAALSEGRPVVALESTLIAHGLPWPDNLEVGRALEAEVRVRGAVPATVAVVAGRLTVGVAAEALERMAREPARWPKAGVGDLGPVCARGGDAATTVSATATAAARAGVRLFATGGIGGVHRGDAMDVSSDLTTLGREPVAVVSAGVKSVLDLPRTLEVLETLGVPVVGLGTDELPAFYTRHSGLRLEHRVEDAVEAAHLVRAHFALGGRGVVLCHPISEVDALDEREIGRAIEDGLADAARAGVRGKAITPHLLAFLARATAGRSLRANRSLACANAAFAADVARALG